MWDDGWGWHGERFVAAEQKRVGSKASDRGKELGSEKEGMKIRTA